MLTTVILLQSGRPRKQTLNRAQGLSWAKLAAPDPRFADSFGSDVAINTGTGSFSTIPTAVIGAYLGSTNGGRPGSAYIFDLSGPFAPDFDVAVLAYVVGLGLVLVGAIWVVLWRRRRKTA